MPKIIMYGTAISPPCRTVWLAAEALGIEFENHEINLALKEQLTEEFLKMNPQHTVPTIDDNGFYLWESNAIICYLANKYAKNDVLYPKDPQLRGTIDQRLQFSNGVMFARLTSICKPLLFGPNEGVPETALAEIKESLQIMNELLNGRNWLVGSHYTLADISCCVLVGSLMVFVTLDEYPNVKRWMKKCEKELPGFSRINATGNDLFHHVITTKIDEAKPVQRQRC